MGSLPISEVKPNFSARRKEPDHMTKVKGTAVYLSV